MRRRYRALAALAGLAAASAVSQAQAPGDALPIEPAVRDRFASYLTRPGAKAMAFAPGTEQSWQAWGFASAVEVQQMVLEKCGRLGSPCVLLAIDDEVVWRPAADALHPALDRAVFMRPMRGEVRATEALALHGWPTALSAAAGRVPAGGALRVAGRPEGLDWYWVTAGDGAQGFVPAALVEGAVAAVPGDGTLDLGVAWRRVDELRGKAEAGDRAAQFQLGIWYEHGFGVERDPLEARRWFEQAAEQGHAVAAYHAGLAHELGLGVEIDIAEALRWFELAARGGHDVSRAKVTRYRAMVAPPPSPPAPPPAAAGPAPP
jgi:hypothetical protein